MESEYRKSSAIVQYRRNLANSVAAEVQRM